MALAFGQPHSFIGRARVWFLSQGRCCCKAFLLNTVIECAPMWKFVLNWNHVLHLASLLHLVPAESSVFIIFVLNAYMTTLEIYSYWSQYFMEMKWYTFVSIEQIEENIKDRIQIFVIALKLEATFIYFYLFLGSFDWLMATFATVAGKIKVTHLGQFFYIQLIKICIISSQANLFEKAKIRRRKNWWVHVQRPYGLLKLLLRRSGVMKLFTIYPCKRQKALGLFYYFFLLRHHLSLIFENLSYIYIPKHNQKVHKQFYSSNKLTFCLTFQALFLACTKILKLGHCFI